MSKFYFYSKSADKAPGKGANEIVVDPSEYSELAKIKDWRKVLSNFHVSPFVFEGFTYNSIEHVFQSKKIGLVSPEKAFLFTLESGSEIGKGDGLMAQKNRKLVVLKQNDLAGIAGIDTRRLTRLLRDSGSMPGAFGTASQDELLKVAKSEKGTTGKNLVAQVSTTKSYIHGSGKFTVVAYDFGIKTTMLNCLAEFATVHVVPATTSAAQVMALSPNGIFLSNGPGDPEMVHGAPETIRELLGTGVPLFGICLGHQLLALALEGKTYKLPFGHHGANHPVRNIATGTVEITSQNHNFCVDADSLATKAEVTHINLNDNTNEGFRVRGANAFSVQYHPEAGPGPHDSRYLFAEFVAMMDRK